MMNKIQIIKCKCGEILAAAYLEKHKNDTEWLECVINYKQKGYDVEFTENPVTISSCKCERNLHLKYIEDKFTDKNFINDACMSFNHSYGLMNELQRNELRSYCNAWMEAILKSFKYKG